MKVYFWDLFIQNILVFIINLTRFNTTSKLMMFVSLQMNRKKIKIRQKHFICLSFKSYSKTIFLTNENFDLRSDPRRDVTACNDWKIRGTDTQSTTKDKGVGVEGKAQFCWRMPSIKSTGASKYVSIYSINL